MTNEPTHQQTGVNGLRNRVSAMKTEGNVLENIFQQMFMDFCEKHKPNSGFVPTEIQLNLATRFHKSRSLFIVKDRQVGFSSLVAAYVAWMIEDRSPSAPHLQIMLVSPSKNTSDLLKEKVKNYNSPDFFEFTWENAPRHKKTFDLVILDESFWISGQTMFNLLDVLGSARQIISASSIALQEPTNKWFKETFDELHQFSRIATGRKFELCYLQRSAMRDDWNFQNVVETLTQETSVAKSHLKES